MAKINPNAQQLIGDYIESLPEFSSAICSKLYDLILLSYPDVIEDWKWRIPTFHGRGMVCGFAGFKKHVSLSFFHGSQMSDNHNLFEDDCNAQNARTIKFSNVSEIDSDKVLSYLKEAFYLSDKGVKNIPNPKSPVIVPALLKDALANNELAKTNFDALAYSYKKEYAEHIATAKQEATKQRRLKKVIDYLEKGHKLNDKYKC